MASEHPLGASRGRPQKYEYLHGWGNEFATEATGHEGVLPQGQNNPQKVKEGLYAEQLSGTAFTVPRVQRRRTWLYRVLPGVVQSSRYSKVDNGKLLPNLSNGVVDPNQFRWNPPAIPKEPTNFVQGLITMAGAGASEMKAGIMIHYYCCNTDMGDSAIYNSDGEFLIVPQLGTLDIRTEMGYLEVHPGDICVIPRGVVFKVDCPSGDTRGYICEVFNTSFVLPDLGPIGANGLANPRDFQYPVASYEDRDCEFTLYNKFEGELFSVQKNHSPFNVVAWHGNHAPYKYDLDLFCTMNAVAYDHPDPSIYCVLTAPTAHQGVAACDFVIFPPRWEVKEHTFRPPYYHRNCMSEFMGLIRGEYEAKIDGGFVPGGSTLHSCMTPHGPDTDAFEKHSNVELKPFKLPDTMAFMFESAYLFRLSEYAVSENVQEEYYKVWSGLKNHHRDDAVEKK